MKTYWAMALHNYASHEHTAKGYEHVSGIGPAVLTGLNPHAHDTFFKRLLRNIEVRGCLEWDISFLDTMGLGPGGWG